MRCQASIEAIIAISAVLLIAGILAGIFVNQQSEVDLFAESYGAQQVCFMVRNVIISLEKNGTYATLTLPSSLNGPYTLEFLPDNLNIKSDRGFICTLPETVYNNTNGTRFELGAGTITLVNYDGSVYVSGPPPDTQPPVITNVRNLPTNPTFMDSIFILWTTDEESNSTVTYRVNAGPWTSVTSLSNVSYHSLGIGQFPASQTIQYYVTSCDTSGNCATDNNGGSYYSFTASGPSFADNTVWRIAFDPNSDFNYKQTGPWTIKAWLYYQNQSLAPGKTVRLSIFRINDGATAANNQLMTDNGDGSYQYTANIPGNWNNDWALIRVFYDDPSLLLDLSHHRTVFVKNSAGSSDRPWKIEADAMTTPYAFTNSSYTVKVWLYNAANATMPGQNVILLSQSETGPIIALNLTMTNNGDGSYQYTIPGGTLLNATDYRIMTFVLKSISSQIYEAHTMYTVEGVS